MSQLSEILLKKASTEAKDLVDKLGGINMRPPKYDPETYYLNVASDPYYQALILLRHYIKAASDDYFSNNVGAKNVDLFMMTSSVSSPMAPGSDSEVIPFRFGNQITNLVDSSQFGFEPLLCNHIDTLYCYLPSMRGEDPDSRHLNQFYHCEAEICGELKDLIPVVEGYVIALSEMCIAMMPLIEKIATHSPTTEEALTSIVAVKKLDSVEFEDVFQHLSKKSNHSRYITKNKFGRNVSSDGEREYAIERNNLKPFWITGFDRDMTAFYQKPINNTSTLTADLIFPPLSEKGFSGEIAGAGQRQDDVEEMYQSLRRQGISSDNYEWYIDLRRKSNYKKTAGFGLGIERFIAWMLGYENIRDVIPYPRLKNIKTLP